MSRDHEPPHSRQGGEQESVRIDAWLVAVRLVKTRSAAAQACKGGHVQINGQAVKPATMVSVGDRVTARINTRLRDVEVTRVIHKRVGAPVAVTCYVDHSPPVEPRAPRADFAVRDRGSGRPTKRDRRQIDRLRGRNKHQ